MKIFGIGDIHAQMTYYEDLCSRIHSEHENAMTIQVGDLGLGFKGAKVPQVSDNDFWIYGNHDDSLIHDLCRPNYLGDFGTKEVDGLRIFFFSGAESVDKSSRIDGETWWKHEEMTYGQICEAIALYEEYKPDMVISHDGPIPIRDALFGEFDIYRKPISKTTQALQIMWSTHKPEIWALGHFHKDMTKKIDGCRFEVLGECEYRLLW